MKNAAAAASNSSSTTMPTMMPTIAPIEMLDDLEEELVEGVADVSFIDLMATICSGALSTQEHWETEKFVRS